MIYNFFMLINGIWGNQERLIYGQKSGYKKRCKEESTKNIKRETPCKENEESRPISIKSMSRERLRVVS